MKSNFCTITYLKKLPEPQRTEALAAAFQHIYLIGESGDRNRIAFSIDTCIHWRMTPQGHSYWDKIYRKYL